MLMTTRQMTLYGVGLNFFFLKDGFFPPTITCVIKGAAFVYYEQISHLYRPYSGSRSTAHT